MKINFLKKLFFELILINKYHEKRHICFSIIKKYTVKEKYLL